MKYGPESNVVIFRSNTRFIALIIIFKIVCNKWVQSAIFTADFSTLGLGYTSEMLITTSMLPISVYVVSFLFVDLH